ncbi:MAG: TlpA disulfide reductase family protein [Hyphomonadaceae bacterium]
MTLKPASLAALLALFAVACQPAETPTAEATAPEAAAPETVVVAARCPSDAYVPPATTSALAEYRTGPLQCLDLDIDLDAPTSPFVDETGEKHTFAEFKGKVLVYNIWAEWCGPCVKEMPSLARLQKAFAGRDVAVVPVAYGFGKDVTLESTLARFRQLVGTDLPFFFDGDLMLQSDAQTGALPATLIYDKTGKEVARLTVPAEWDAPEAIALIQAVLDGKS